MGKFNFIFHYNHNHPKEQNIMNLEGNNGIQVGWRGNVRVNPRWTLKQIKANPPSSMVI